MQDHIMIRGVASRPIIQPILHSPCFLLLGVNPENYFFFFLFGAWVNAEPATDFTVFEDFGFLSSFEALDATVLDVRSFLAIISFLSFSLGPRVTPRIRAKIIIKINSTRYCTKSNEDTTCCAARHANAVSQMC